MRLGKRSSEHSLGIPYNEQNSYGETSFSMVYRTESVILVEIGMPRFRTSNFDKENNEAELRLNLDLLDEKRERVEVHQATYKHQVAKY